MKRTPAEWNALSEADFTALLGGVYEHSPWIAEAAAGQRPFGSVAALQDAMRSVVETAPPEAQLALIQAHPDLAGRLAKLGQLTPESTREQAAAGLDAMSPEELQRMTAGNEAYRAKFGFPFIICARRHTKESILDAMAARLQHDPAAERAAALQEIHHIAQLRMEDILCQEN
jgi:2-oxo-4-hydroxy-4-carboxy-5-ureidoimidazoline decarboxylase